MRTITEKCIHWPVLEIVQSGHIYQRIQCPSVERISNRFWRNQHTWLYRAVMLCDNIRGPLHSLLKSHSFNFTSYYIRHIICNIAIIKITCYNKHSLNKPKILVDEKILRIPTCINRLKWRAARSDENMQPTPRHRTACRRTSGDWQSTEGMTSVSSSCSKVGWMPRGPFSRVRFGTKRHSKMDDRTSFTNIKHFTRVPVSL